MVPVSRNRYSDQAPGMEIAGWHSRRALIPTWFRIASTQLFCFIVNHPLFEHIAMIYDNDWNGMETAMIPGVKVHIT